MRFVVTLLIALVCAVPLATASGGGGAYRLGSGDQVRVTVFGEEDLSGTYGIDGEGRLALPLIGPVVVGGLSAADAEAAIAARYAGGYLKAPKVALEVLDMRPFYILGEVQRPGAYPYASGLSVVGAVALAGGYTYRADEDEVEVSRGTGDVLELPPDASVLPGDVIRVGQRFF